MPFTYRCDAPACTAEQDVLDDAVDHRRYAHPGLGGRPPAPTFQSQLQAQGVAQPFTRSILCRRCARPTSKASGAWLHEADGSPACVDPDTL